MHFHMRHRCRKEYSFTRRLKRIPEMMQNRYNKISTFKSCNKRTAGQNELKILERWRFTWYTLRTEDVAEEMEELLCHQIVDRIKSDSQKLFIPLVLRDHRIILPRFWRVSIQSYNCTSLAKVSKTWFAQSYK
ncbi:hypothetical protein AVEN_117844-1 [Araneus ventricosus]|uniref:Uncharacterized protein n=1 Tax=Araneus ventricosus TaxID=182803 RepID=A0A4Y2RJR7_ARAVE|nr:hypothetical protein AVEN_117844-1 [Araneus ventricosus]